MNLICIGKIVNTHGIKGELRLLSSFCEKELVFKPGFKIYIGSNLEEHVITSYRVHKNFDMICLQGLSDINLVLKYKGQKAYINKEDLSLKENEYLLEDLIGMDVICDNEALGIVSDIYDNKAGKLLYITFAKNYYIPYNNNYIKQVDVKNKKIYGEHIKDLIVWELIF